MNTQWLRSFILSAEYGSFTRAAKVSYVTPTALIQQINLLERDIGFSLFQRKSNGIRLTTAGQKFLEAAEQILSVYDTACKSCQQIEKDATEIVRIAYSGVQFPTALADLCCMFAETRNTKFRFESIDLTKQLQSISDGAADVCLIAEPKEEYLNDLIYQPLFEDTYSLFMSPNHPLACKPRLSNDELRDVEILYARFDYMKQPFETALAPYCGKLSLADDRYELSTRMDCYMSSKALVSHHSWREQYTSLLAVVETEVPAGSIGLVYRSEDQRRMEPFIRYLQKHVDDLK